jgi:hypothetical protein
MIDLKQDAKALQFASLLDTWLGYLQHHGHIGAWQLCRRKLNLAADAYRDFWLTIEVENLAQLDRAFHGTAGTEEAMELHARVHDMIASADIALYRPYPDSQGAERMALV